MKPWVPTDPHAAIKCTLWWISEDEQESIPFGLFGSYAEAAADIPRAKRFLLEQCGDQAERDGINRGHFSVEPTLGVIP